MEIHGSVVLAAMVAFVAAVLAGYVGYALSTAATWEQSSSWLRPVLTALIALVAGTGAYLFVVWLASHTLTFSAA